MVDRLNVVEEQTWVALEGHPNYLISLDGNEVEVRSIRRTRPLKKYTNKSGEEKVYLTVDVDGKKRRRTFYIKDLIRLAVVPSINSCFADYEISLDERETYDYLLDKLNTEGLFVETELEQELFESLSEEVQRALTDKFNRMYNFAA